MTSYRHLILLTVKVDSQRNKIPWDDHVLLQLISEYFPACDRPLNCVKEAEFHCGIRASQARAAILDLSVEKNPANEFALTHDAAVL